MMLPFTNEEYRERLQKVKRAMAEQGMDVFFLTEPANMNWVSGYDAMSFYVPQGVVVSLEEDIPYWIGRFQDQYSAHVTTWLDDEHIRPYADKYLWGPKVVHVMDFVADFLKEKNWQTKTVGVEKDAHYFTAHWFERLTAALPDARFADATNMVNFLRAVKSKQEQGINAAMEAAKPGVTCEEVERVWQTTINKYGLEKESRMGYAVGIGYPPVWMENTSLCFKPGEKTVLQPNMTFHMMPGLWLEGYGVAITECIRITDRSAETITKFPRRLFVK